MMTLIHRGYALMSLDQWTVLLAFLTAIFTFLIAGTGVVALVYAALQLRHSKGVAEVQHLHDLIRQFDQEPLLGYRKRLGSARLSEIEDPFELREVLNFFEYLGLLTRRGYLNEQDVWECYGTYLFALYVDSRKVIEEAQLGDINAYTNVVDLYSRLADVEVKRGGNSHLPSPTEIKKFWESEKEVIGGMSIGKRRGPLMKIKKHATF